MRYALRRTVHAFALLAAVSALSFVFADLAPGDFFSELESNSRVSRETVEALRSQRGLDRPLIVRYGRWLRSVGRGEFGYSLAYNSPVGPLLAQRIPGTLLLTATSTCLAWLVAVPLGIWMAAKRGSWAALAMQAALSFAMAIPEILLAIVLLVIAAQTGWLPVGGMHSTGAETLAAGARLRDTLRHLAIPVSVLVLGMAPMLIRHVSAAMTEVRDAPFALAARTHGIAPRRLLFRHLLPVALNPLVTLFGLSLGGLLSASLLVEVLAGWPGLGPLFLDAILSRDFALVLGVIMSSTVLLIGGNLVADLLLYRVDPRIRVSAR
jgi:peptide/nickel transport system permease protein